ncbi:MAG: hypothetical protein HC890_17365 [Chloroflexaceae bacterium]|nr:hypothetical protein [Chloroflexaceae bacterium]
MDREQQVKLNFLEEAEAYYDRMESALLGGRQGDGDASNLDEVLRAAHSIKGGAAMMGFTPLSRVAHRLEDFLKILRARHGLAPLATDLETLLLQGVDSLRRVNQQHRLGRVVEESWLEREVYPPLRH